MEKYKEEYNAKLKQLDDIRNQINCGVNQNNNLIEAYNIAKEMIFNLYQSNHMIKMYLDNIKSKLLSCENNMPNDFIIESDPIYYPNKTDFDNIIEKFVHETRKQLLDEEIQDLHLLNKDPIKIINSLSFVNYCDYSSYIVSDLCSKEKIKSYRFGLYPGYSQAANLCNNNGYHYFNIIKYNNDYYLVDCTYRQFFRLKACFLERIGIVDMLGCSLGRFASMTEPRKEVAQEILKKGYIKLNEEVLKEYLDCFSISYRNGLYYEKTNDYSYETIYTADDYIKFLTGDDNQINHEGKEVLGYQKIPTLTNNK